MPNEFEALIQQLGAEQEALAKSLASEDADGDGKADDKEIQAAAEDGKEQSDKDAGENGEGEGEEAFGKSFTVTLADGSTVEAIDGTEMMKALHAESEALRAKNDDMSKALQASLGAVTVLTKRVGEQDAMLKSLRADLTRIGGQGAGRRTVVTVHEKAGAAEPKKEGITPGELMAKAMGAMGAGRITAGEAARLESYVNRGIQPPADILAKLAS